MSAAVKALLGLALAAGAGHGLGQHFHYVEPGVAACSAPPAAPVPHVPAAAAASAPPRVVRGVPVAGRLTVACGFEQGSYTVTLNATDPGADFAPRTFLVNFGRLVGNGAFTVTFSTPGVHGVSTAITSNMGSPPVRGRFVSSGHEFNVVNP